MTTMYNPPKVYRCTLSGNRCTLINENHLDETGRVPWQAWYYSSSNCKKYKNSDTLQGGAFLRLNDECANARRIKERETMKREEVENQIKEHLEQILVLCKVYDVNFKTLSMFISCDDDGYYIDAFNEHWDSEVKPINLRTRRNIERKS